MGFSAQFLAKKVGERLRGNTIRGNRTERVSERTSEREGFRSFQRFSEGLRGSQRFSEVCGGFQRFFRGPLRDPLRGRFPSQRLSVLLPLILLPLNLSPNKGQGI